MGVFIVLDSSSQSGLWYGSCGDSQGWFPASHVRLLSSSQPSRPTSTNAVAEWEPQQRQRRARVVEELMHTERDYVRLLEDIVHVRPLDTYQLFSSRDFLNRQGEEASCSARIESGIFSEISIRST